jgi:hypothetical protein
VRGGPEGVCKERALEAGTATEEELRKKNLWEQIELLKRYVPKNIVDNLLGFRFLGNEAQHELAALRKQGLAEAIKVMEDVMNVAYDLDYKSGIFFQRFASKKP